MAERLENIPEYRAALRRRLYSAIMEIRIGGVNAMAQGVALPLDTILTGASAYPS